VIQGAATGQIFFIFKTRTVIGRSGADINLDDFEFLCQHVVLEIVGDVAILRDFGSTNGTWIELERIEQHQLGN
jgi:pSer/pThr/pTyr-binding forkhead associated (FHA) protein